MGQLTKIMRYLWPLVLVAMVLLMISGQPAQASSTTRMLSVTGHGRGQTPTTLAQITLGLSDQGDDAQATYGSVKKRSVALMKVLKAREVTEVKTSNVNLMPQYDRDGKLKKAKYDGYQNVVFQMPAEQIGILDTAIATGVERIDNISFIAPEAAILKARESALTKAMADAQAQANVALEGLGFSIQEIIDIQVDDARVQTPATKPVPVSDDSYLSWRDSLPLIEGGEQTIDVNVTLKIRY